MLADGPAPFPTSSGWTGPGLLASQGRELSYWDLHGFLLVPTLWLLTAGSPELLDKKTDSLKRQATFSYLAFILSIAVAQAFVWDSVGAQIGIWEFNPQKTTGLGAATLLPLEEILWLFHHVIKAALWQLKMSEVKVVAMPPGTKPVPMSPDVRIAGNALLATMTLAGVGSLLGDADHTKCIGLVAAFFSPVLAVVFNLGSRYFLSHWRLFVAGWLLPGCWTVFIDCIGQQQNVWRFPSDYLSGAATIDGLLKLDIALVYLVSTFAVTATGAIIIAAAEEFERVRQLPLAASSGSVTDGALQAARFAGAEPTLWDLGLFIFDNAFPGAAGAMRGLSALPDGEAAQRTSSLRDKVGEPRAPEGDYAPSAGSEE